MTEIHLPWETISGILCRLPVKDLLRYRSVSKSWRSMIDSRDFINLRLKHSLESNSQLGFVFGGRNNLYWTTFNDLNSFVRLTYPIDIGSGISVHGSSNGLLVLMNSNSDMAIWNPSTRRYTSLPISEHFQSFPFHEFEVFLTGFGHDPINDNYKLLLLMEFNGLIVRSFHCEVKLYSSKSKTWKKIDHFPKHIIYRRNNGVLVGNSLHWLVKLKSDHSNWILAFDLVTESFCELGLPDYKGLETRTCVKLVNLGGSLCAVMIPQMVGLVDVWEMKGYGVKESWTKLFSVPPASPTPPFSYMVPVAYLKNGDQVLLQDSEKLFLFDMKRKSLNRKVMVGSGFPDICDALVCVESLVGFDFGESTWNGKNSNVKEKKKKSGKKRDDFLSKGFKLVIN